MDIKKSCRLCLNKVKGGINLFKKQAKKLGLLMKIKKYLSLNIIFNDQLPKRICNDCLMKINEFHSFATVVLKNQDKMTGRSILPTPDGPEISKTDSETSLLLRYLTQNNTQSSSSSSEDNEESEETETEIDNNIIDPMSILQCCLEETDESTTIDEINEINGNFEELMSDDDNDDNDENTSVVTYLCSINNNDKNANEFLLFNNENIAENNSNKCPICAKAILTQTALRVHLETHRPKGEYVCDICGRVFKTQFNLCRHQNHHKIVQFPCEVCGRVYEARSTLKAHSITHSDLRPHKCPLCVKTFKRNQDLKFHINQHTGARPYECPYCPKAFASSGNCFSHRKRMHPVEVEKDKQRASKMMK